MNADDFISGIKVAVCGAATRGVVSMLEKPPCRRPRLELMEISQWFSDLPQEDREMVARVANLASDQATYNFLLVLDGLLAIEPSGVKGKLELIYNERDQKTLLNDPNAEFLSDLFKSD